MRSNRAIRYILSAAVLISPLHGMSYAQQNTSKPDQNYIYAWRAMDAAGLPNDVLARRKSDKALIAACEPAATADKSGFIIGLIIEGIGLGLKALDKALTAREEKYLESLSSTTTASATNGNFPVDARSGKQCLIVDRISDAGDDRATYVLDFIPVGDSAFTVEIVGARLTDRALIGQRGLPDSVNADIALSMTIVEPDTPAGRPEQHVFPVYAATVKNLDPRQIAPEMAKDPERLFSVSAKRHRSAVLPMPKAGTPTTLSVVVVESNGGLSKAKERIALARKVRAKLIELTGGIVKEQLDKLGS